ncbi:enolase-phosphatase E-1-like protein 3, partial [Leptotrombidium deliense]
RDLKQLIANLRAQVEKDRAENPNIPALAEKNEKLKVQVEKIMENVIFYIDNSKETNAHYKLKFAMWKDAYENQRIETHIYSDAAKNIKKWRKGGIKTYIYSNAWSELQKLFLRYTTHGNLSRNIDGYFDTSIGKPTDVETFKKLLGIIKVKKASDVLFITKNPDEAMVAKKLGITCLLIISHAAQLKKIDKSVFQEFQKIRTFDELKFTDESPDEEEEDDDREED